MDIRIKKDGSLKYAYGGLSAIFLVVSMILYVVGMDSYINGLIGSGLTFLLLLSQLDSRPVLIIDDIGLKKKGNPLIKWSEVKLLKFKLVQTGNGSFINFEIWRKGKSKSLDVDLKRTTITHKELYLELINYTEKLNCSFDIIGLDKWNEG